MSYLLEALRKSERERQQKTPVPGLQTPTVEWESGDDARGRSPWLMVAVLAICLNTILVAVLVWRFGFADAERAAQSAGMANNQLAATAAPQSTTVPAMPPVIVVQQPREPTAAIIVRERGEQPASTTLRPSKNNSATSANTAMNSASQHSGQYDGGEMTDSGQTDRAPVGRSETAQRSREAADAGGNSGTNPGTNAALVAGDSHDAPSINALPQELRQQLPFLTMNSHIYANNARDSFVLINGVSLNPGDEISAGLKLVAVVPEGAILVFNGQRFLLPALASFSP